MISGFKQYPATKNSGVEWLGDVPAHWDVRRLGQIGTLLKGRGGSKEDEVDEGIPCVRYGDLYTTHTWTITETRSSLAPEKVGEYTSIRFGDVLFAASGETADEIGKSAVNLLRSPACCGGDIILFRSPRQLDPRFMGYASNCGPAAAQKARMGRGFTIVHIYPHQIKRIALAIPPLSEQTAIARFVDHATVCIDRYIRAKEKLIALLGEYKQILVHDAVTGRVDVRTGKPYQTYKPSGLEWLGEIPAHWQVVRNGQLFVQRNEVGFPELPILEVSLRTGIRVRDFENSIRKQVMSDRNLYKRAVKNDIAYNMMRMWQGAVGVAPVDGLVSPAYVVARPREGTEPRYFDYIFRTGTYLIEVDKHSRGIVKDRNRLYWEDFKQMPTPRPPTNEQVLIADTVDRKVRLTQEAIRNARQQIILANEFRTGLINDIVTGKLDVREAAGALPVKSRTQRTALDDVEGGAANQEEATGMIDWNTCPAVERKPGRVSGAWVFAGTRIPLSALYENLAGGATVDEFVEWFPGVDEKQVREVLQHEAHALKTALAR